MIQWKRFIAVWPITALGGSFIFWISYGILGAVGLISGEWGNMDIEETVTYSFYFSLIAMIMSIPTWLILIIWTWVKRHKPSKETRIWQLSIHFFGGIITLIVLLIESVNWAPFLIPLIFVYLILGHTLLRKWGLKPRDLP